MERSESAFPSFARPGSCGYAGRPRVETPVRKVHLLPNLLTLANSFCGLLAICKGIDALQAVSPDRFYANLETSCWLIFAGMLFDAVDGKVARMVGGGSAFGAQLDSFSDMLTF